MPSVIRAALATLVVATILISAWSLSADPASRNLVMSLLTGAVLGAVLQRARFCFLCNFRDFVNDRRPDGLVSIIVALAVGAVLYMVVIMAWVPVPQAGRLPPNAHIGPVGGVLAMGAFVFGIGMAVSGSCLSAHLYRLGEGSPTSPFALLGAALGFLVGFVTWNPLYLTSVSESPIVWLPHSLGYAGSLALTLVVLGCLLLAVVGLGRPAPQPVRSAMGGLDGLGQRVFSERWPPSIGGIAVGVISAVYFFRVAPLGVTAELGSLSRTAGSSLNLLPETLLGLDGLRGCATVVKDAVLSPNGLFVLGIIAGSFVMALLANQFRPRRPTGAQILKGLAGGLMMGWGAMVALGCTIGVLLSGIHAGALSGWVFLVACTVGIWSGLVVMRRLDRNARA